MTRALRSPSWPNLLLAAYIALIAVLLFTTPAHAAPSFSIAAVSCPEGGPCAITIRKSVKATSYSKLQVTTLNGTAKAGVDYSALNVTLTIGNSALSINVPLSIAARAGYQGNRGFAVHIKAVRNAVLAAADALVTIVESEPAPAPTPAPTPTPTPVPSGTWVAAPLTVGGYAKAIAAEQSVPKTAAAMGNSYSEAVYRTVLGDEVVKLGGSFPDYSCACAGQPREWAVYGLDKKFIGYVWEANLVGVAPAP